MNYLPNLVQFFLDAFLGLLQSHLGAIQTSLTQVDRVREQRTTCMNTLGIAAFFQLNSFAFQELADVFVKLIFSYWIHN